ncbi:NAD(P)/FAD-dependent oxidoreductase [Natronoglycomyces albus]|uniref:FAD-dependent oxidoreductase n=1 Tax=Natronoglycomyces albus TaxID=2811108 RepID=A0A895XY53_9ACTN|nr:FAD-dependent oxidoreductase [Natronoglycomyces albus]QSB06548.1 FAD-dependent oxidoreductase [Natronoglycomyces albus]
MTHRIVILGAGYAGVTAANRLAGRLDPAGYHLTLVNGDERFVERVRLHQVAVGQDIPRLLIRDMVPETAVEFRPGFVTELDVERQRVTVEKDGQPEDIDYDTLIYALGSTADGPEVVPGQSHTFTINHHAGAVELSSFLDSLDSGEHATVVGAGMTGIEMATELAESRPDLRTRLIDRGEFAPEYPAKGRNHLLRVFDRLNIDLVDHTAVAEVTKESVLTDAGHDLASAATIWTSGFSVHPLAAATPLTTTSVGRIVVDGQMRSVSHPNVFAIGDAASADGPGRQSEARMACGTATPMAMIGASSLVKELTGQRQWAPPIKLYARCISLGRSDGLFQTSTFDDVPKRMAITGRFAARQKELICKGALWNVQRSGFLTYRRTPSAAKGGRRTRLARRANAAER